MARADQLSVPLAMGTTHHAIDLGDGNVVGWNKSGATATIRVHTLAEFHGGQPFKIRDYADSFDDETVLRRALSRAGETGYNAKNNNCESFCCWCKTGREHSSQVWHVERAVEQGIAALTKTGAKAFAKTSVKASASVAGKALTRMASPWLFAPDGLQIVTSLGLSQLGVDEKTAEAAGKGVGFAGSVGVGAALGSPLGPPGILAGGAIGGGFWLVGEGAAAAANRLVDLFFRW